MNYKLRLFFYFLLVFVFYTVSLVGYEQWRERTYRIDILSSVLESYTHILEQDSSVVHLPSDVRVTMIANGGRVTLDNSVDSTKVLENHFNRPEVIAAKRTGSGYDIRQSATTGQTYFYYVRRTPDGYIRVALPYTSQTQSMLTPDLGFVILAVLLFMVAMGFLWLIARRFGHDVEHLKVKITNETEVRAAMKAEMTSAIAHELRTPTSAIRSYSETLCSGDIDEEHRRQFAERIHSASIRLSELLSDVSLLTKMEEASEKFTVERVDVGAVAREVVSEFSAIAQASSVKIECSIAEKTVIDGNSTLVYSIFRNLVENAIKYGGRWISVNISLLAQADNQYTFCVSDTGQGLDEKHLGRLFERFYRVDQGRTRDDGGSGLGLSIVAHAVAFHCGTIFARNGQNGGLEVVFTLNIHR